MSRLMMYAVGHFMALVPLFGMMLMGLLGKTLLKEYWLLAVAFSMSWVGDSLAAAAGGSWTVTYLWLPVQFWFISMAFLHTPLDRVAALGAAVLLSGLSLVVTAGGPDTLLTVAGSVAILLFASGRIAIPLRVYFGLGTVAYVLMVYSIGGELFMSAWYAYQSCRLLAYAMFLAVIFRTCMGPWEAQHALRTD